MALQPAVNMHDRYANLMSKLFTAFLLVACLGSCGAGDSAEVTTPSSAGNDSPTHVDFLAHYNGRVGSDAESLREALPYDKIELEYFTPWLWGGDVLRFWRDGRAELGDQDGWRHGKVNVFDFARLCYLIDENEMTSMLTEYSSGGFDKTTVTVRVWPVGQEKPFVVEDYGSAGPIELWAVQAAINGVARTTHWKQDTQADPTDR